MSRTSRDWRPPKYDRVRGRTPDKVNREIDELTASYLSLVGTEPHAIRKRLWELDREWHVDRALIAAFALVGSATAQRAFRSSRPGAWRLLFWTQIGFLVHHAIRGWCPPVFLLRRLGFRTDKEIAAERSALEKRLAVAKGI